MALAAFRLTALKPYINEFLEETGRVNSKMFCWEDVRLASTLVILPTR